MACATGEGLPPAELKLAWMCDGGRLPESGGVLDQPYSLMIHMSACGNVYSTVSHYKNAKGAEIHNLTNQERRLIRSLIDNELLRG